MTPFSTAAPPSLLRSTRAGLSSAHAHGVSSVVRTEPHLESPHSCWTLTPASPSSPHTRSTSPFPGLYLQTLRSSHGCCQQLRRSRCSCHCSPLAHLSFTAASSCHHHHLPLDSSKFLPGHTQTAAAQPQPSCPGTQGASPVLVRSPAPVQSPSTSTQQPQGSLRLLLHPRGTCPLHQHQHAGQRPKRPDHQSTAVAKGALLSGTKLMRQGEQPAAARYAPRHSSKAEVAAALTSALSASSSPPSWHLYP